MSHLSIERLAALADEQPTADEQTHLAQCAQCMTEFNAHRSLLAMAGSMVPGIATIGLKPDGVGGGVWPPLCRCRHA